MNPKPLITVVVPAMNEEKYIPTCIDSLHRQTFRNFEVIVVSLSHDTTNKLCQAAGLQVIVQQGKGVSTARKQGFEYARGDIIASTDADSQPDPNWLENIASYFSDPQVVCVYGPTRLTPSTLTNKILSFCGRLLQRSAHLLHDDKIWGMNFAVRKTAYLQTGGFNPHLIVTEDLDLGSRIKKLGQMVWAPDVIVSSSDRRITHYHLWKFLLKSAQKALVPVLLKKADTDFKPIR